MITISLCMIVKNEEKVLSRCLDSVKDIVDEIVIVDTGSTDHTKEIAQEYDAIIYDFEWINDFSKARNFAFSKGTKDYLMWLDADDVILEEDRKKLMDLKEKMDNSIDVVMMKYNIGKASNGEALVAFYRERLLKRLANFKWVEPVHEYIEFKGNVITTDITITHRKEKKRTTRNLNILEQYIQKQKEVKARHYFYYARELFHHNRLEEAIMNYEKYFQKDTSNMSQTLDACMDLYKIYKLHKKEEMALQSLLRYCIYFKPRAEICCLLGNFFKKNKALDKAIFWYEIAITVDRPKNWGFFIEDCWGFIPCAELSYCYFQKGDYIKAEKYNDKALVYKKDHPALMKNKKLIEKVIEKLPLDF
ncbi:glycosyltransferase involved in cell wall biosynthesis [Natranaerovirga hydrolytica]|uniref:Glycosyltransferase involved in cell wall biosynthesis n=1 Tax=Natranaerovirga hydrolytica TaxID=680378 RepID=A0A4R1MX37_9FIRM|nr:glycosyltransferase family 2 protein [Natranaerovirga hydrolytica]TCK97818.1 glycosyltransferase involved in cell wall biosynthesis [Natranaerovirga hydrolytica]